MLLISVLREERGVPFNAAIILSLESPTSCYATEIHEEFQVRIPLKAPPDCKPSGDRWISSPLQNISKTSPGFLEPSEA
jgi:hypothetical protein